MSAALRSVPAEPRAPHHAFGELGDVMARLTHGRSLLTSPGPVADAFVADASPVSLLNGPRGSAKTTSVFKKVVVEAIRMKPIQRAGEPNGVRRYVPQIMRPKYKNLWGTSIPSWWKLFPTDAFPEWRGANGRDADHLIRWRDAYGLVELDARFRALAEGAEEDDTRGTECTDAVLEEMDTHDVAIITNISGSLARDPVRGLMNRGGKIYGSCNAPDVMNWVYTDFWFDPKPGYKLHRQPGGLDPGAENIEVVGRAYYEDIVLKNAHRPWYVDKMVHNRPGFTRDKDVVYPDFDDATMTSPVPLKPSPDIPVVIGFDGGLTPAALFQQHMQDARLLYLAEVALDRGGEDELATACKQVMAEPRFANCSFIGCCDPAMDAGADTKFGSMRKRLEKLLGITILICRTNEPELRHEFVRAYLRRNRPGRPGLMLDPSCKRTRRGFMQTFHYHRISGTNARAGVVKTPDSHVCEAGEYGASLSGEAVAMKRQDTLRDERMRRMAEDRPGQRYNPLSRSYG